MKTYQLAAAVLIVLGILALTCGGFTATAESPFARGGDE
jgi:hypothetical protein